MKDVADCMISILKSFEAAKGSLTLHSYECTFAVAAGLVTEMYMADVYCA